MFRRLLQQLVSPPRPATARPAVGHVPAEIRFKVIVADFYDRVSSSGGEKLAELLQGAEGLDVASLKADFDLSFLNFESRNFFDLIDRGQNLLEKTGADVLIWGCREENRLRLNFQTPRQYEKEDGSFVCLLDSMYLPADALAGGEFPQPLLDLLTGTVVSAADRPDKECRIYKKYLLKKIIARISKIDSAKSLGLEYMPYIMNQLGLIYMTAAADGKNENDFKIIANLFETALKYQKQIFEPTHLGCIYLHLGQLNDCASVYADKHSDVYFRAAIADYRQAQKYFGKYTYPYDHGHICYKLSGLYYNYWKRTEDLQALRDSVSQLRECERIFTRAVPRLLGTYRRQSRLSSAQPRPPHAEPRYLPAGSGRLPQPAENRHRKPAAALLGAHPAENCRNLLSGRQNLRQPRSPGRGAGLLP